MKRISITSKPRLTEWLILAVLVASLVYSLYYSWKSMQISEEEILTAAQQEIKKDSKGSSVPSIPELKLNNHHQRQGEIVRANPDKMGRSNPFLRP